MVDKNISNSIIGWEAIGRGGKRHRPHELEAVRQARDAAIKNQDIVIDQFLEDPSPENYKLMIKANEDLKAADEAFDKAYEDYWRNQK